MLLSIPSANEGYRGVQPMPRNLALLTRLLVAPRLEVDVDLASDGTGRFSFSANHR